MEKIKTNEDFLNETLSFNLFGIHKKEVLKAMQESNKQAVKTALRFIADKPFTKNMYLSTPHKKEVIISCETEILKKLV